ncbi:MAG: marine proteobacterial sortase target protein [Pseudomonadota bacterium]
MNCESPPQPFKPSFRQLLRRWLNKLNHRDWVLIGLALYFGLALAARAAADPLDEVSTGSLFLDLRSGASVSGLRLSTDVVVDIYGMVATVNVSQRFSNESAEFAEGTYVFPLPDEAAVNALTMRIGDRLIEGEVQEKKRAADTYREAARSGRRASLLSQDRPNLFTSKVANLGPGETIQVEITYVQPLTYRSGLYRLRYPMAILPRFDPRETPAIDPPAPEPKSAETLPAALEAIPQAFQEAVVNPTTIRVNLDPGFALSRLKSVNHDVSIKEHASHYEVHLTDEVVASAADFELIWEPALNKGPQAALFVEATDQGDYGLLMVLPPQADHEHGQPRELVLVVDSSGSMFGASLTQAQQSIEMALGSLTDQDRFNVIDFDSEARALFAEARPATLAHVGQALDFVAGLEADGGTEIRAALDLALTGQAPAGYLRQVVFITDGSVANETELFAQIEADLGASRLFTVGIGPTPNSYFMRKAAHFGRGSYTYVSATDQVAERMDELLTRLEYPALKEVCVDWPSSAEAYPARLPDLYQGEPLVIHAQLDELSGLAEVCGMTALASWNQHLDLAGGRPGVGLATLWARKKVESLMDELALGGDADQIREDVLKLGLDHQLVTRYTSFVAVDRSPVRPADLPLSSTRMAAMAPLNLTMPATATGALGRITLGLMVLLLGVIVTRLLRSDL